MTVPETSPRPKARILGPGLAITLEDAATGERARVRVRSRDGRKLTVEAIPGAGVASTWTPGAEIRLRVARPFGLFCYSAKVESTNADGGATIHLADTPPKRQQLRDYFRMPIRIGVRLEDSPDENTATILQGQNLSAGGILLLDAEGRLQQYDRVRLGLPIGPSGSIVRVSARVVRVQDDPRRVALSFESINESTRRLLLRYLFREHLRRGRRTGAQTAETPQVTSIKRA